MTSTDEKLKLNLAKNIVILKKDDQNKLNFPYFIQTS